MKFYHTPARIYAFDACGTLAAEITFPTQDGRVYCITHTFVAPSLAGQGIAGQLVHMATEQIRAQGGSVTATCAYASHWLEKHAAVN